jgi:hypothetical protein
MITRSITMLEAFEKKNGYKPEWGANNAYMSFAIWARMVSEANSFYPPDIIKQYEKSERKQSGEPEQNIEADTEQTPYQDAVDRGW